MLFRRKAASANRPIKRRAAFVARLLPPNPEAEAIAHQLAKALATIQVEVEHRRRLEAKLLTAVEEERQRLGRDLHDELSQRLAATALMTHTLAKEAKGRSELDREKIRTIWQHAVGSCRGHSQSHARLASPHLNETGASSRSRRTRRASAEGRAI